jgi:hypothetical protein
MKKVETPELSLEQKIEQWKKEHKYVYQTTIADEKVIWRILKRSEYVEVMNTQFNENEELAYYERQEAIARKVILFPESESDIVEEFAGVAEVVSTECMIKSGYGITHTEAL